MIENTRKLSAVTLFEGKLIMTGIPDMQTRRQARELALQTLFANEFLKEDPRTVYERVKESLNAEGSEFALELVLKTSENQGRLTKLIKRHLRNWTFKRVATLDRIIICMAVCEMTCFSDIPIEVTINEALEISKDFCNLKSSRFINGILDSIYKKLRTSNNLHKDIRVNVLTPHPANSFRRDKLK